MASDFDRENISGDRIETRDEIYRTLKSLQLTRSQLTLKFSGEQQIYASLILDVSLEKKRFIIDELTATQANTQLQTGAPFTLIANHQGVDVILKGEDTQPADPRQFTNAFSVRFPNYIYHKQRRNAFRAGIRQSIESNISIRSEKWSEALQGRITDLSSTGIGCEFKGAVTPGIHLQEFFDNCFLTIDQAFNLHCGLVAKHPVYHRTQDRYSCGFQFYELSPRQQQSLDRYLLDLQRHARKVRLDHSAYRPAVGA